MNFRPSKQHPYTCKICGKVLSRKQILVNHTRRHNGELNFKCDLCCKRFVSKNELKLHTKARHDKPKQCIFCDKMLADPSYLYAHIRMHTREKPINCSSCGKCFARRCHFSVHQLVHNGNKSFQCKHCLRKFARNGHLKRHLNTHMQKLPGTTVSIKPNGANHQLNEYRIRNFSCVFCEKAYYTNDTLREHIIKHIGEKPHQCDLCKETFSTVSAKHQHIKRHHTLEKTNVCQICGTGFFTRSHLKRHLLIHPETTTKKRYSCVFCDTKFHANESLRNHILSHICEKPYVCEMCGMEFKGCTHKTYHTRRFHKSELPYLCKLCEKGFETKKKLQVHQRTHD